MDAMNLQATRGKILIEILKEHTETESGIIIARTKKEIAHRGKVLSVGLPAIEKKKELSQVAKIGDIVYFKKYAGKPFWIDNKPYLALKRDEILAGSDSRSIWAVRNTLLVELKYAEKIGSIYLHEDSKQYEGNFWGEVISVGPEVSFKDQVKRGDKVHYLRHEGFTVQKGFQDYISLREKWIAGKEIKLEA